MGFFASSKFKRETLFFADGAPFIEATVYLGQGVGAANEIQFEGPTMVWIKTESNESQQDV